MISRVDEELRAEMVEAQSQVARWVTEMKASADSVALRAQRALEGDKGERMLKLSILRHPARASVPASSVAATT